MNLGKVAASFETTAFDVYNEVTDTWELATLQGKIRAVDRFLSNFNRPTKRRLLGLRPDATIPTSKTLRVPSSGEIYIIGELRKDAADGIQYDQTGVLHRALGVAAVSRKAPAGPSNDPGWLVASAISSHYADVELRSASEIDEQHDDFEGHFFLMLPDHADIQEWDEITLSGETYMVNSPYYDSGYVFARVIRRADQRADFTYHSRGAGFDYNSATRVVTDGLVTANVTGFAVGAQMDALNFTPLKAGELKVIVKQAHIGVSPSAEDELTWTDGLRYKVKGVHPDFLNDQYQLDCTL